MNMNRKSYLQFILFLGFYFWLVSPVCAHGGNHFHSQEELRVHLRGHSEEYRTVAGRDSETEIKELERRKMEIFQHLKAMPTSLEGDVLKETSSKNDLLIFVQLKS